MSSTSTTIDTSTWQERGQQFDHSSYGSATFSWSRVVANTSGDQMETRWDFGDTVVPAEYCVPNRSMVENPSVKSFTWVNQSDVDRGEAILGHELATYQGLTQVDIIEGDAHLFETPSKKYWYHASDGYLVKTENKETGNGFDLDLVTESLTVPDTTRESPDHRPVRWEKNYEMEAASVKSGVLERTDAASLSGENLKRYGCNRTTPIHTA
jgi:hypothetical protein